MTRILGLTHYLGHHQLPKQGLCLWFSHRPESHYGRSSVPYQCRTTSPKNIQINAPNARYGPKGNLADQTGFPTTSVIKPITEPRSDPAKRLNNTARQPRNAPIAARNFKSPRPIASRGMTSSRVTPEMFERSSSIRHYRRRSRGRIGKPRSWFRYPRSSIRTSSQWRRRRSFSRAKYSLQRLSSVPTMK